MITAHSHLTIEEQKVGYQLWAKTQKQMDYFLQPILGGVALVMGIIFWFKFLDFTSFLPFFIIGIICIFRNRFQFWNFKKKFKSQLYYGCEMSWLFDEQGYEYVTEGVQSKINWQKNLHSVVIAANGLLILVGKNFFWISLKGFASQEDFQTVCSYIRQSGVKVKTV